jgi:methionyl-tRNA formyltransferase
MRDLSILFMGTPDFAVATLAKLQNSFKVCGVVTAPDKPSGRGQKLNESAVKKYAISRGLEVLQPTNLKSETFLKDLKRLQPNLIVVVAFRMLPRQVWEFPEYGTFNIHASLLPEYRGAAPINWAIINGEKTSGVTSFFIDEKIDTGKIISRKKQDIKANQTAGELHDQLMVLGAELAVETCNLIEENKIEPKQQPDQVKKEAPKLNKTNTQINWNAPASQILNLVNGLNPYPMAWTLFKEDNNTLKVKIGELKISEIEREGEIGDTYILKKQLLVKAQDKWLELIQLKYPGKRLLKISDFLNGYQPPKALKLV